MHDEFSKRSRTDRWSVLNVALRKAGLLAAVLASTGEVRSMAQESPPGSSPPARRWLLDERQQPRHAQRATHRGFEVSTGPIHAVATTSFSDAQVVAEHALAGWNDMAKLADHLTSVHRQANFAADSLQVTMGAEAARGRDQPITWNSIGPATQISVHVTPGLALPENQQGQLRQAAAVAFLHAAELDRQLPDWVCQGLAAYASKSTAKEEPAVESSAREPAASSLAVNRRRFQSEEPRQPAADRADAAQLVHFLIEGNDARHAGEFFDCLRDQLASSPTRTDREFQRKSAPNLAVATNDNQLDRLVTTLATEFEEWKKDPQIGQPQWTAGEESDDELKQGQEAMLFVLKLAERFSLAQSAAIRTRITTFEKGKGSAVLTGTSATRPPPLRALLERITASDRGSWATVGPDGDLIWSADEEKLRELLGVEDNRYEHVWENDRWVLASRLADGRQLLGWLEPNADHAQRPLAKFSFKSKESSEPRHQPVGQRRAQPVEPHQQFSGSR